MSRWQFRIAPYLRPERRHIAVLALLAAFGVAIEALLPWPLKLVIDNALAGAPLPEGARWIGALPGAQSADGLLAWLAFSVLLLFLGVQLVALMRGVLEAGLSARLRCALGATLFDHLQRLSLIYHRRAAKGDLMRRVTEDTDCLPALITAVALPIFTAILSLVVLFVIMWKLHPMLTVVAALVVVPMALLMRLLGPQMSNRAYEHQQAEGKIWSVAEQTLTALPVVQAFGRETEEQSRFRGVAAQSIRAYLRTLTAQLQFRVGIDGSQAIGMAAIMIIGGWHVLAGSLSLGTLVVFLGYLTLLYAPLLSLAYLAPTLAAAAGSARRVEEVLDAPLTVIDATNARPLGEQQPRGHVRLKGVVFGYEPDRPVLRGVDFEAHPGELVSLVGATGAGKSTLVSLIPRLFDPWEGSVTIDDQDLRTATISSVRESVAFVLQDPFLLPSSIADNIAYGRPSATRAEIETAARLAGAEGFIRELPQGLDTVIGERGSTLSGGQRQRIAIARAFLKDAPILIMDEPTSALDVATENEVLDAMARLAIGRTTIVIAHRLSTIRRADRVVVLDHGMVAESGTHEELMAGNGLYRRLYGSTEQPTANLDSDRSGIRG